MRRRRAGSAVNHIPAGAATNPHAANAGTRAISVPAPTGGPRWPREEEKDKSKEMVAMEIRLKRRKAQPGLL